MQLQVYQSEYSVCQLKDMVNLNLGDGFVSITKTDEEISIVCESAYVPQNAIKEESGWKMLRICGILDFSLVGVLARIAKILGDSGISVFVVSTYNTDYILLKAESLKKAVRLLSNEGYQILGA